MKTLLITVALLTGSLVNVIALSSPARPNHTPADSATYKLTIGFTKLTKRTGTLYVGLINSEATFNGPFYRKTRVAVPATGEVAVSFEGLPAGRYAVQMYQDLNENQKLDVAGQMPTEPFGFSNVTTMMGPPSFGQCAFDVNASKTIVIQVMSL